jgi:hypothetical protein
LEISSFQVNSSRNNLVFRSIEVDIAGFQVKLFGNIWLSGQFK